jgi:cytochrome c-type biogenesis protein CcmF
MSTATFKVYINPLINWTWAGAVVMVLGTLIAAWSSGQKENTYVIRTTTLAPETGD